MLADLEENEKIIDIIHKLLVEVQPKHIDEVGFYNRKDKLMLVVFPAIQAYMSYSEEELDREWLKKSSCLVRRRPFSFSDVHSVRVFSEEVHLQKMISDFGDY